MKPDRFTLDVSVDLTSTIPQDEALQAAITAILQTKDGRETYWALCHPGPQADFHLRDSFVLELNDSTRVRS